MVVVCQSPGAFLPHGSASEGWAPRLGSHRPRVALWHSAETRLSDCGLFSWVCQTVWLKKEMVFISLTDRDSALVTASRSNLLRFLVLPLGTHLENHMPSPDAAWSEGRQWPPLSPMCDWDCDWDCDWAWESTFCGVYILLFSFLKFIYFIIFWKQNQKHN